MKRTQMPKRKRPLRAKLHVRTCAADGCTRQFETWPSRAKRYCSKACWYATQTGTASKISDEARERLREQMRQRKGKTNPNFRHGRRVEQHNRELIRAFNLRVKGDATCRSCGTTEWVQPHHAVPRSIGTAGSRLDIRNCLPLCSQCHTRWHRGSLTIYRDAFTEEEWAYISTLELTGRQVGPWLDEHYPDRLYGEDAQTTKGMSASHFDS